LSTLYFNVFPSFFLFLAIISLFNRHFCPINFMCFIIFASFFTVFPHILMSTLFINGYQ